MGQVNWLTVKLSGLSHNSMPTKSKTLLISWQFFIFEIVYYCALFNCKFITCMSIGINVNAVIIYIHSLPITVIHAWLFVQNLWLNKCFWWKYKCLYLHVCAIIVRLLIHVICKPKLQSTLKTHTLQENQLCFVWHILLESVFLLI